MSCVMCLKQFLVALVHRSCVLLLACVRIVRAFYSLLACASFVFFHCVILETYLFVIFLQDDDSATSDEGAQEEEVRARKRCSPMISNIRERCRDKLLKKIDARYLAPKSAYKLFKETSRGETIQLDKLVQLCLPIIESVVENPTAEKIQLFMKQMKMITKKRREHHKRSWLKKKTHARLIFGGELPGDGSDSSDEGYVSPPRRSKSEGKPSPSAKSEHPNAVVGGPNNLVQW